MNMHAEIIKCTVADMCEDSGKKIHDKQMAASVSGETLLLGFGDL